MHNLWSCPISAFLKTVPPRARTAPFRRAFSGELSRQRHFPGARDARRRAMAPTVSTLATHRSWRNSPLQKDFIERRLSTLPTLKAGRGVGLDTTECGLNWRRLWRTPWAVPEEPALQDAPAIGDFHVRPVVLCAPLILHERFFPKGLSCPTCENGGDVTGSGWNPSGPRKVRAPLVSHYRARARAATQSDD